MTRLAAAIVALLCITVAAQQQIIGGHTLDANLMVDSYGINTRVPSRGFNGLSLPTYSTVYNNPQSRAGAANALGVTLPRYWTPNSGSSTTYGYQEPARGVTYATSRGPASDALASPLYKSLQPAVQVQRGTSGTYLPVYRADGIVSSRYSPMR